MQSSLALLQKFTGAPGTSGHEQPVRKLLTEELASVASPHVDRIGCCSFELKGTAETPRVMFVAHMDEVGFVVAGITKKGTLKVQKVGGWDTATLQSSPVEIINSRGEKVFGMFGSVPVHFQKDPAGKLEIEDLSVDIGASSEDDVRDHFGIRLGNAVVPSSPTYYEEHNRRLFAKALDDRVGVCALAEMGQQLKESEHPNRVLLTGSVQEEVGLRGATVLANYAEADAAIILEGPPSDDLIRNELWQCKFGAGVNIRVFDPTLITSTALVDFVADMAEQNHILYHLAVRSSGGTDAARLHMAHQGIPSIVLGVPVRYAHSHLGCISMEDYEAMLQLALAIARNFDNKVLQRVVG